MSALLAPLELLYRGVNRVRRALYRRGVLRGRRLPRPVISVGNIAAGGTGKTPAVITLCRYLSARGLRVAVLTRGYGRGGSETGPVTSLDAGKWGDEPTLIKSATDCTVIVGSNRFENAIEYLRENDVEVFVLDDGFQHLQLERDVDIVIDVPARFYREGRSALRDADFVVPRRLRLSVPDSLRGVPLFAFAGLADNAQFFASLREAGLNVTRTRSFPDHHRYTAADLAALRRDAGDALLVTTGKDAVKVDDPSIAVVSAEFELEPAVLESIASRVASPSAGERRGKRRKNVLLQRLEYMLYKGVSRLLTSMSEESVYRWGTRVGALSRRLLKRRDRLAMRNLEATFPEQTPGELRRILDECWRHFGRETLMTIQYQNLSLDEVAARCPFVNQHYVEEAMARGKGTLLISGHWGGWEIAGLSFMSLVSDVRTVARPLDNELLEADLQQLRARTGARVVDRRRAARFLMKALAENAVVVLLPDQAVLPREGVLSPFLGRPAWTTPATAKMALRTGATIVFAFCIPDGLRHRLEFESPIRVDQLPEEERNFESLTRRINDVISRRIRERPDLWLWMHDRWKGTGESEVTNGV